MLRLRRTLNGTEVWDSLAHRWRVMDTDTATRMLSNSLFPRSYSKGAHKVVTNSKPKPKVKTLADTRTLILKPSEGGSQ